MESPQIPKSISSVLFEISVIYDKSVKRIEQLEKEIEQLKVLLGDKNVK